MFHKDCSGARYKLLLLPSDVPSEKMAIARTIGIARSAVSQKCEALAGTPGYDNIVLFQVFTSCFPLRPCALLGSHCQ